MAPNDYKMVEKIKQVIIKHRTKIYTETLYLALNSGREKVLTKKGNEMRGS